MPIYQYRCQSCGANIEKLQTVTADPLVECPECHQSTLKKVLQSVGIIFKGAGWYITDSKKSSSAVKTSADGNQSGESKTTETTSTTEKKSESTVSPSTTS